MSNYSKRFTRYLNEQDENDVEITDKEAMTQTLDKGTAPEDFDVDAPAGDAQPDMAMTQMQKKMYDELKTWIEKIDGFANYLNGTDSASVQSRLNSSEPDTLFDKISVAETKKIARVSVELASLSEMLKGYLASAHDPKYKYN